MKGGVIVFILFIVLMAIGYVVTENIADQLESQDDLEQETIDAINRVREDYISVNQGVIVIFICFVVPSLIILIFIGRYTDSGESCFDTVDVAFKQVEETRQDAVDILKRRFAMGEIDIFEYTERMSRL